MHEWGGMRAHMSDRGRYPHGAMGGIALTSRDRVARQVFIFLLQLSDAALESSAQGSAHCLGSGWAKRNGGMNVKTTQCGSARGKEAAPVPCGTGATFNETGEACLHRSASTTNMLPEARRHCWKNRSLTRTDSLP